MFRGLNLLVEIAWYEPIADDGEEQDRPGGMLHLFRGLTNLRVRHPVLANGEIGAELPEAADWIAPTGSDSSASRDPFVICA